MNKVELENRKGELKFLELKIKQMESQPALTEYLELRQRKDKLEVYSPVQICCICGESVAPGSGKFVNRVPQCDDLRTRVTNGYSHPLGDFICAECDSEDPEDAIGEGKNAYYIDPPSPWIRADSPEEALRKWRRYFYSGHWSPEDESVDLAEEDVKD